MTLQEIMNTNPISVEPSTTAAAAARQMARSNVGSLPVCREGGMLCGFVTDRDLTLRCLAAELGGETPVSRVMSGRIVSAEPGVNLAQARSLMERERIRRLPVTRGGKLVGVVSMADVVAALEGNHNP